MAYFCPSFPNSRRNPRSKQNRRSQRSRNILQHPLEKRLINAVFGTYLRYSDFSANFQSQNFLTNTIGPTLTALTPDGAAYLNEADFQQPDWKRVFYGANYDRLDAVKAKYDPLYTFYALRAVGSDLWVERKDGHLCEA